MYCDIIGGAVDHDAQTSFSTFIEPGLEFEANLSTDAVGGTIDPGKIIIRSSNRLHARNRILCCVWGELRGVYAVAPSMNNLLFTPLDADVLIYGQRQLEDDEKRLEFLKQTWGSRLVSAHLYEKPDPLEFFSTDNFAELMREVRGNWRLPGNLQVLMNHVKLGDFLEKEGFLEKYDLFVFTRSDLMHVVPFPSAEQLCAALRPSHLLTQAGHEFGGVNYNLIAMRSDIALEYLCSPRSLISAKAVTNSKRTYNIERLWKLIFAQRNWKNLRMSVTCFISAESKSDRRTFSKKILASQWYDGALFKYETQMVEAHRIRDSWQSCRAWHVLRPPQKMPVQELHGNACRSFALILAAEEGELLHGRGDNPSSCDEGFRGTTS